MASSFRLSCLVQRFSRVNSHTQGPVDHFGIFHRQHRCLHVLQSTISPSSGEQQHIITPPLITIIMPKRSTSFFNKLPADQLWKGVTSVSNAGKKRGRGKGVGKKMAKDLNRGQAIGIGKMNIVWPGLNAPVLRGKELVTQQKLPKDEERESNLIKLRDTMGHFRPFHIDPIERGWTGSRLPGRSIGPPDPVGDDLFENFDTRVLEFKTVTCMSGIFGRVRRMSMFVVTGNANGLAGFALAKGTTVQSVMRKVKNRAGQKLIYLNLYNNHTVFHDFFCQFHKTKIFVKKKPEGYGLVCHRAIRTICQIVGIKDLYAKVEGSTCVQSITRAFFLGLLNQKTHQQLADEKSLYLVEFREEQSNFPHVVASPTLGVRTPVEIAPDEELNFNLYTMGGKVELARKKYPQGYERLRSYEKFLKKQMMSRNHEKVRRELKVEHGAVCSFYTELYPECLPGPGPKPEEESV